jgi:hypothetical protein
VQVGLLGGLVLLGLGGGGSLLGAGLQDRLGLGELLAVVDVGLALGGGRVGRDLLLLAAARSGSTSLVPTVSGSNR